jgi:hypothetical protein
LVSNAAPFPGTCIGDAPTLHSTLTTHTSTAANGRNCTGDNSIVSGFSIFRVWTELMVRVRVRVAVCVVVEFGVVTP